MEVEEQGFALSHVPHQEDVAVEEKEYVLSQEEVAVLAAEEK